MLAACLDVALSRLPEPGRLFALGIDRPVYFSVHSAAARLAPRDAAVIHVMKYLSQPADNSGIVERELELLLDRLQPGWRELVVQRRFLPSLTVAHRTVTAESGGLGGRPGPELPGVEGVYLAGDWVGPVGMLADASFASGRSAAERILNQDRSRRTRPPASLRTATKRMTTQSQTAADEIFEQHRELLFGLAYRMLGSVVDAEDVLQDAYLRWRTADVAQIKAPKAYLTTAATRLAIDRLRMLAAGAKHISARGCRSRSSRKTRRRLRARSWPNRSRLRSWSCWKACGRSNAPCSCCTRPFSTSTTRSRRSSKRVRRIAGRSCRARRAAQPGRTAV